MPPLAGSRSAAPIASMPAIELQNWETAIRSAEKRIAPHIVATTLLEDESVNRDLGFRLLLKPECLQTTGSFKLRGAANFVAKRALGPGSELTTYSAGNHAQGVARAAQLCGAKCTIFMPSDAPHKKIDGARALGAEVLLLENFFALRDGHVKARVESGAVFVPPFDHEDIIAGQGTIGREIISQSLDLRAEPSVAFVPTSGGGLLAGISLVLKSEFPDIRLVAVEPEGFDDFARSIAAGNRVSHTGNSTTLCDGLKSPRPGEIPFDVVRKLGAEFCTVSDGEVKRAMKFLFDRFNLVAEPSGAAAIAAILTAMAQLKGSAVVAVVSGGNVDPDVFARFRQQ